jgi:type II secretory ATPase GspE/PulE/Tfp pilus assembly ATPase PilB-like protein
MINPEKLKKFNIACDFDFSSRKVTLLHDAPIDPYILQDLKHSGEFSLTCKQVSTNDLEEALKKIEKPRNGDSLISLGQQVSLSEINEVARIALNSTSEKDAPIVKLLDGILTAAISRGASDLHFDQGVDALHVKIRLDGTLTSLTDFDARLAPMLIARLKILGNLDITERRRPQDGRIGITYNGKSIDIRIASLPVQDKERVVLRFFRHLNGQKTLPEIGLAQHHVETITKTISNQSGIILISGPTGSGKTTTIYSILNMLRGRGLNIMTIEDPVEVELLEIVQSQVNETIGFDFASGLRSLLRHDPDVILVGEIRDQETASTAIRAALTGHLVIASIHANSPHGVLMRLLDLGVELGLISDSLLGIFNQRLIRTYCSTCRSESINSNDHNANLPTTFKGCVDCYYSGFTERVPIMEHLIMTRKNRQLLLTNLHELRENSSLAQDARNFYDKGLTPFFEVMRVSEQED